ncbi:MAG: hypothetical protein ACFFCS_16270 [Candidatus Hodarchaeota archaeon]
MSEKTRLIHGPENITAFINEALFNTRSSSIVVTPECVPAILETMTQAAYQKKGVKFFYTTKWDIGTYKEILKRMVMLGNVQFRDLKSSSRIWSMTRDGEEILIAPEEKGENLVGLVSTQGGYARLFSQVIGPMFQAQSKPLKL